MNLYIDINSRQAVNGIGVASPIQPITFKDQDTPSVNIYFVLEGVVQDEGSGTAIKFGLNLPPPNPISLLVYDTTFTRQTDVNGNIFYQGFPVFYTSQLAAALGSNTSIQCVGEVRTQLSDGEIFRSMDIPFMIWRTILLETTTPPPDIVAVYPDASTLEIIPHKGQPSGYAGLDSGSHILGANIPVDGVTIQILDGQIAAAPILAETSATFVTPAAHVNVTVTLVSSTGLVAGQYVRLPIAGYYIVESIPDGTHAVLQNNGDPVNAASGITIAIDTPLLPAQAAAGGGTTGQAAFTQTTASFTVPAIGSTVSVSVISTAWMGGNGYNVFITGAGYYVVQSITDTTHVVLTNTGSASNAIAGATVPSGATVAVAGPPGAPGTAGASGTALSAYDALSTSFTMPAAAANVTIAIASTAWLAVGQVIYIASAGYFQVASISSATQALITNLNYPGNASAGGTIASGSKVSAGGLIGATGSGGAGKNAFTNLAANFTQPAVNATVSINVGTTAWMAVGQVIFVQGGGYYSVASITDLTDAVVANLGYAGSASPGATVTSGSSVAVTPGGLAGQAGRDAFTVTAATFAMPTSGATVTVTVGATAWMAQGQVLYLPAAGYFSVSSIIDATHVVLTNLGYTGNATAGTVIASGSAVVASGVQGPAGTGGGGGGTLTDATTAVGYSWISNPAGILKRIVAGSSALTIADSGSVLTVDAPGAGGGGGMIARTTAVELFDDFVGMVASPSTTPQPLLGWMALTSGGSGGSIANQTPAAGTPELGLWQHNSPTSGAGVFILSLTNNPGATIGLNAQGTLTLEWRLKMSALESGTNYADHRFGFAANPANATWIGCYFQYIANSFANWQCVGYNGSTAVSSDSGIAVSTSFVKLTITMNAAWTTATFAINGTTVATLTSQSFGANGWMPSATAKWGAGTPQVVQLDWFYAKYSVTR